MNSDYEMPLQDLILGPSELKRLEPNAITRNRRPSPSPYLKDSFHTRVKTGMCVFENIVNGISISSVLCPLSLLHHVGTANQFCCKTSRNGDGDGDGADGDGDEDRDGKWDGDGADGDGNGYEIRMGMGMGMEMR